MTGEMRELFVYVAAACFATAAMLASGKELTVRACIGICVFWGAVIFEVAR
jgi:hypothetical protein